MTPRVPLLLTRKGIEAVAHFTCPARQISSTFNFIVDTGSEVSLLAWEDAAKVDIEVDSLPSYDRPMAGFGGRAEVKHVSDMCCVHLTFDDGKMVTVDLPDGILVWRPSRRKTQRQNPVHSVSILGRDFLLSSGFTLFINLSKKQYYLERED